MTAPAVRTAVARVHVVVPAHDEEVLLPRCLESVRRAAAQVLVARPWVEVSVTVVADACSDGTAGVARAAGADVVEVDAADVGTARRVGVAHAGAHTGGAGPTWLAHTDADTVVPPHWLLAQLHLADAGFELVVGSATPDPADLRPHVADRWRLLHRLVEGHPHVHGANLGVSLRAYDAVGGFTPGGLHEDVRLVRAVRDAGYRWCATASTQVTTSGREHGRVTGGFASYLARLA
ncbi:MAG: glycosyltransferase [Nocardioides sp.]